MHNVRFIQKPFPLPPPASVTRLVIVGDVHDLWSESDVVALRALHPDMTLFVGDIGNEAVELVERIASIELPKTVILGNHDAFFTNEPMVRATLDRTKEIDRVNAQLDALGVDHVGFTSRTVHDKPVSIVGARPFSSGGAMRHPKVIENLYGYRSTEDYVRVITETALSVPEDHAMVVMGHNGPSGLGDRRHDICGVDFRPQEGDHGDEDLRLALLMLKESKRSPTLVTFGHMHHRLRARHEDPAFRRRLIFDHETETLFLNVAVVRRVITISNPNVKESAKKAQSQTQRHHFCLVEIEDNRVTKAEDVYVRIKDGAITGDIQSMPLFERQSANGCDEVKVLNTHLSKWEAFHFSAVSQHNVQLL